MVLKTKDYVNLINKTFDQIGKLCSTPKIMTFMTDGKTYSKEEHPSTFSSMNFVWKIISELPMKHYLLMNKQQAIRFIRVVKQRLLKVIDIPVDFYTLSLTKVERKKFDQRENKKFIDDLTKRIQDLTDKYKITDMDLYIDNPAILKREMAIKRLNGSLPQNVPSSDYRPITNLQYKEIYHSDIVKTSIAEFKIEMDKLDDEDKTKYKQDDTLDILWTIGDLKTEYSTLYSQRVYAIPETNYNTEIEKLQKSHLNKYNERLVDIRKSAHSKFTKKRFGVKNKKNTRKNYEEKKERAPPSSQGVNISASRLD